MSYKRILVAIDHSDHRRQVIAAAADLAQKLGSEVVVVHAQEDLLPWSEVVGMWPPPDDVREQMSKRHLTLLEEATNHLRDSGVSVAYELLPGGTSVASRIIDKAEEIGADLITIGAKGSSELVGLLIGSVSHKVIHLARCHVLVVHVVPNEQEATHEPLR